MLRECVFGLFDQPQSCITEYAQTNQCLAEHQWHKDVVTYVISKPFEQVETASTREIEHGLFPACATLLVRRLTNFSFRTKSSPPVSRLTLGRAAKS